MDNAVCGKPGIVHTPHTDCVVCGANVHVHKSMEVEKLISIELYGGRLRAHHTDVAVLCSSQARTCC